MYCYILAAPRLACVRPVASVHPEPGSNSSLYISFLFFYSSKTTSKFISLARLKLTWLVLTFFYIFNPNSQIYPFCTYCLSFNCSNDLFFALPLSRSESGAKITPFCNTLQIFGELFSKKFQSSLAMGHFPFASAKVACLLSFVNRNYSFFCK